MSVLRQPGLPSSLRRVLTLCFSSHAVTRHKHVGFASSTRRLAGVSPRRSLNNNAAPPHATTNNKGIEEIGPALPRFNNNAWAHLNSNGLYSSRPSSRTYAAAAAAAPSGGSAMLSQTTSFLRNLDNGAEVFLVGTAHVSARSADEVREMIDQVKPDVVMVELCPQRARRLMAAQNSDADFFRDALGSLLAPGTSFGGQMFKLSLQGMYRVLDSLGMNVGGEFKAAMLAANRQGAKVVYGDRDVQETLARLSATVQIGDFVKLMAGGGPQPPQAMLDSFESGEKHGWGREGMASRIEAQVEALKSREMARQMSQFLRQINPALAAALIDERDDIMVEQLRRLKGRVVGVVGLAHLDGIERKWAELQPGRVVPAPVPPQLKH